MFRQIRYQTGEGLEITSDMKKGNIPCLDVDNMEEFEHFFKMLSKYGMTRAIEIPLDRNARDRIKEPEFEFRAAFYEFVQDTGYVNKDKVMYMDVYFEPDIEETYDSVGEM